MTLPSLSTRTASARSHPTRRPDATPPLPSVARRGARPGPPADGLLDPSMHSFPASDPPSWSPLRVGAPAG